ncbi:hypothetical protein NOK12_17050 [Nocardioides sp. OK12]|nr:hypothetical protein NOK12_17050 [Nocardioides sp. OK12]
MSDRSLSVSLHTLSAVAAWILCGVLMGAYVWSDQVDCGALGLAASAVAATLSIKCFCVRVNQNILAAFELGKEAGRTEGRPLTRV